MRSGAILQRSAPYRPVFVSWSGSFSKLGSLVRFGCDSSSWPDVKPRTGSMIERSPGIWRLQSTSDPDAVTGTTRRLSRTFRGTKVEAAAELRRFVSDTGAGLQGGSTVTVAVLLTAVMTTATLSPTTRQDWTSVINRYLIPERGDIALWKLTSRDCDHMYQRLRNTGLGPSRVRNAHVILHQPRKASGPMRTRTGRPSHGNIG